MTDTLMSKLVEALSEMPDPIKNADNPALKRGGKVLRYADLEATLDACKPILAACGIALMQMPVSDENGVGVHTILIGHGEQMDCGSFTLPMEARNPQKAAGSITYARRYALTSLFGLAQEDDDANGASATPDPRREPAAKTPAQEDVVKDAYRDLKARADENGNWERIKAHLLIDGKPAKTGDAALAAYRMMTAGARATLWTLANAKD